MAAIVVVVVLLLIVLLAKHASKKKKKTKSSASNDTSTWSGLYRFAKEEIDRALDFGSERTSLGRGSAGQVYKGILPSGQLVAIKKIFQSNTSDSFIREVEGLSRVRHQNLVCLLGCCIENGEQYLVYEYCEQGNLAQHLLSKYYSPIFFHYLCFLSLLENTIFSKVFFFFLSHFIHLLRFGFQ